MPRKNKKSVKSEVQVQSVLRVKDECFTRENPVKINEKEKETKKKRQSKTCGAVFPSYYDETCSSLSVDKNELAAREAVAQPLWDLVENLDGLCPFSDLFYLVRGNPDLESAETHYKVTWKIFSFDPHVEVTQGKFRPMRNICFLKVDQQQVVKGSIRMSSPILKQQLRLKIQALALSNFWFNWLRPEGWRTKNHFPTNYYNLYPRIKMYIILEQVKPADAEVNRHIDVVNMFQLNGSQGNSFLETLSDAGLEKTNPIKILQSLGSPQFIYEMLRKKEKPI